MLLPLACLLPGALPGPQAQTAPPLILEVRERDHRLSDLQPAAHLEFRASRGTRVMRGLALRVKSLSPELKVTPEGRATLLRDARHVQIRLTGGGVSVVRELHPLLHRPGTLLIPESQVGSFQLGRYDVAGEYEIKLRQPLPGVRHGRNVLVRGYELTVTALEKKGRAFLASVSEAGIQAYDPRPTRPGPHPDPRLPENTGWATLRQGKTQ
ncbi:hypothetical protein Dgeo_1260 [Deinococcus geothermalis DSM 11300]|uniref:Uncharacterized protein n=1 Tax=Deinococcus geothermalis (strain DSM 11300 / CIP 105573 / AG-3a) TaxID=319795 RepID=Q1IYX8_DEIGD|nr:hypothetical protein Dgeo_1260 [Deinococcus geothermalis DSM 11300]